MSQVPINNVVHKNISKRLHICAGFVCNNSCMFCMDSSKHRPRSFGRLERETIYKILRDHKGMEQVCFTRGEPTLNSDLIDYIKYARCKGYKEIAVISNGRQYRNVQYCLGLIRAGVREFTVSVHGHDAKIHDALTRSPGSFVQTAQGLKNLSWFRRSLPIRIHISHVVNKKNYRFLDKFLGFVAQYLIDGVVLNTVQPRGEYMEENFSVLMPRYADIAKKIENILEKKSGLLRSNVPPFKWFVSIIDMPLCISGRLFCLMGLGEEVRCAGRAMKLKKFTTASFKEKNDKCLKCKYGFICDGVFSNYIKHFGWGEFVPVRM